MSDIKEWLQEYQRLSESDDASITPEAHIAMAWEYFRGDAVERDFDKAVALFRKAELAAPELARFNLAKALYLNRDPTFADAVRADCEAGYGPALYLMGVAANKGAFGAPNRAEAVTYFNRAGERGHLVSEFLAWRLQRKSALQWCRTLPYAVRLGMRMARVRWRDKEDIRVLD